jgi:hypothetical protein
MLSRVGKNQKKKGCQPRGYSSPTPPDHLGGDRGRKLTALSQLNRRHWRSSPFSQHLRQIPAPLTALGKQTNPPIVVN